MAEVPEARQHLARCPAGAQHGERRRRLLRPPASLRDGSTDGVGSEDEVSCLVPRRGIDGAAEQGPQVVADAGPGQGVDDGEGVGALHHVVAGRLAELTLRAHQVPDVVPDLKGHPEVVSERRQGVDPRPR